MQFILSPIGSAGDVYPYVGLAIALRERGHDVSLIVNGYFQELVARHEFPQVPFGTAEEFLDAANDPDLWHPRKALPHIVKRFITPHIRTHYDLVVEQWRPGATVVTSCLGVGALVAQDKHQIPVVTLHLQPAVIWSDIAPPRMPGMFGPDWLRRMEFRVGALLVNRLFGRPVNGLRRELDLPPVKDIMRWWHSRTGSLCLFPEWFAAPQADWPEPLRQTDFPLWDAGADEPLAAEVAAFLQAGEPPLVFTPGTANRFGRRFFSEAVEASRRVGRRAILLSKFTEQFPATLPSFAAAFSYVPLKTLLPHCAAVAHHGGVGSTAQGMRAGIPQLIMALAHDQYDNGSRIERLGAGAWLPSRKFRAGRVARMLTEILEPAVVQQARSLAQRIRPDGLPRAAEELESLASRPAT